MQEFCNETIAEMKRFLGYLTNAFQYTNSSLVAQLFGQSFQGFIYRPAIAA